MALVKLGTIAFVLIVAFSLLLPGHNSPALPAANPALSADEVADVMPYEASQAERDFGLALITAAPKVEVLGDHAEKHAEAPYVRQTCRQNGVYQVWRETADKNVFHLLCMTVDGKLVDWVVRVIGGKRIVELTAFQPKDGTVRAVVKYVLGKATRFTKEIVR